MKKITIAILMFFGTFSIASAEVGVNAGVTGNMGVFSVDAEETMGTTDKNKGDSAIGAFGYASIFVEKELGDYFAFGIDYNPTEMDSEQTDTNKKCSDVGSETASCNQVVKVSFKDMTTFYATVNVTENLYVKAGIGEVDVITKESLGTGGTYGDTSLDFNVFGAGYNKDLLNGLFVRAEGNYMDFDDIKLNSKTGETRFIKASNMHGASAKISIGKSF
jgi:hypothetical protein